MPPKKSEQSVTGRLGFGNKKQEVVSAAKKPKGSLPTTGKRDHDSIDSEGEQPQGSLHKKTKGQGKPYSIAGQPPADDEEEEEEDSDGGAPVNDKFKRKQQKTKPAKAQAAKGTITRPKVAKAAKAAKAAKVDTAKVRAAKIKATKTKSKKDYGLVEPATATTMDNDGVTANIASWHDLIGPFADLQRMWYTQSNRQADEVVKQIKDVAKALKDQEKVAATSSEGRHRRQDGVDARKEGAKMTRAGRAATEGKGEEVDRRAVESEQEDESDEVVGEIKRLKPKATDDVENESDE